jgi:hypothetical protein
MTKSRNHQVAVAWSEGMTAINHTGAYSTRCGKLYSYDLLIGETDPISGIKVLRDYTANGKHGMRSQTTSCHVGLARIYADLID